MADSFLLVVKTVHTGEKSPDIHRDLRGQERSRDEQVNRSILWNKVRCLALQS